MKRLQKRQPDTESAFPGGGAGVGSAPTGEPEYVEDGGAAGNNGDTPATGLAEGFAQHRAGFGGDQHPYMASLVNDIAEVTYEWAVTNGGYNPADSVNGLQEFLQKSN